MSYTLEQFSADCRAALLRDPGPAGRELVRQYTARASTDADFVAKYLGPELNAERKIFIRIQICIFVFLLMPTGARRQAHRTITGRVGRSTVRSPASPR